LRLLEMLRILGILPEQALMVLLRVHLQLVVVLGEGGLPPMQSTTSLLRLLEMLRILEILLQQKME